jgi:Cd(II)/Pb(II)-responsive transcriptional regulator
MRISELAAQADAEVDTVRYYEKTGLLPAPQRLSNGYRAYTEAHLQRLLFIRRCRLLDIGLSDVGRLLDYAAQPQADCAGVDALIDLHLGKVRERMAHLQALEQQLSTLRKQCGVQRGSPHPVAECGILQSLEIGVHEKTQGRPKFSHPPRGAGRRADPGGAQTPKAERS